MSQSPRAQSIEVAGDVRYISFAPQDAGTATGVLGITAQGQMIVADLNGDGRVVGLQLMGASLQRRPEADRR
jgi:hypothetical protein